MSTSDRSKVLAPGERGAAVVMMGFTILICLFFWGIGFTLKQTQSRFQELQTASDSVALSSIHSVLAQPMQGAEPASVPLVELQNTAEGGLLFRAPNSQRVFRQIGLGAQARRIQVDVGFNDDNDWRLGILGGMGAFGGVAESDASYSVGSRAEITEALLDDTTSVLNSPGIMFVLDYSGTMTGQIGATANLPELPCLEPTDRAIDALRELTRGRGAGQVCGVPTGPMAAIPGLSRSLVRVGLQRYSGRNFTILEDFVGPLYVEEDPDLFVDTLDLEHDSSGGAPGSCNFKTNFAVALQKVWSFTRGRSWRHFNMDQPLKIIFMSDGSAMEGISCAAGRGNDARNAQRARDDAIRWAGRLKGLENVELHTVYLDVVRENIGMTHLEETEAKQLLREMSSPDVDQCDISGAGGAECYWDTSTANGSQMFLANFVSCRAGEPVVRNGLPTCTEYETTCEFPLDGRNFPNFVDRVVDWDEPVYAFLRDRNGNELPMQQAPDRECLFSSFDLSTTAQQQEFCGPKNDPNHQFFVDEENLMLVASFDVCQEIEFNDASIAVRYGEPRIVANR